MASGDAAFSNLSVVEGAIEQGHEGSEQLKSIRGWLHAYIGVKARIFELDSKLKEQYANLVSKSDADDHALALEEFRLLHAAH